MIDSNEGRQACARLPAFVAFRHLTPSSSLFAISPPVSHPFCRFTASGLRNFTDRSNKFATKFVFS